MSNMEKIKNHLLTVGSITTYEAFLRFKICHLAKYIQLLKKELDIADFWVLGVNGKRHKNYVCGGVK